MPGPSIQRVRLASDGDARAAIAAAGPTPLQSEVARIMGAVRNKLAGMDVRLEDMSDVDIIIFVSKRQYRPTR
jgi:hypothetical protein